MAMMKREAAQLLGGPMQNDDTWRLSASFDRAMDSLWAAYQPIVSTEQKKIFGYEALLRSGEPSLPHPGAVIDAAERLCRLEVLGRTMRASVNGEPVLKMTVEPGAVLSDGTIPALNRVKGRVGLQRHTGIVRFRSIEIKELPAIDPRPPTPIPRAAPDQRVYELRTYTAAPGKLGALQARFRDHTGKLFAKHGITGLGYWVPIEKPENTFVYLVAHTSREAADQSWTAFTGDPEWQRVRRESERNGALTTKVERLYLTPTHFSPVFNLLSTALIAQLS